MKMRKLASALLLLILVAPWSQEVKAQDRTQLNFLYGKFVESAQQAELRQDFQTAVGMYEAALERTSTAADEDPRRIKALTGIIRSYTKLGYFWRYEPALTRLIALLEGNQTLINATIKNDLRDCTALLTARGKIEASNDVKKRLDKLASKQSLAESSWSE